jgi:leucyl/phenylalanyl-tRNA--protein transferase
MVLIPGEFKMSGSLTKVLRSNAFELRIDSAFGQVTKECAAPRGDQPGTWISNEMIAAYSELHRLGYAHSIESWQNGRLAGGLYGVAIGRMFYGESMFSRVSNASKIALSHLCQQPYELIDCQMHTPHLASLGGRLLPRDEFIARIGELTRINSTP